ncbi:MAG: phosphomannomutase [Fimbriimonadaceae bacterium]
MGQHFPAFKAYDIRGKVPSELDENLAYSIGRAYADQIKPERVCLGHDIRLSGPDLGKALAKGLNDAGVDVVDLGMVGTEMVYFATGYYGYDGGIMITASHNPPEYNGMKLVRSESRPISGDTGLKEIEARAHAQKWEREGSGKTEKKDAYEDFTQQLLKLIDPAKIGPLKIFASAGNGAAGPAMAKLSDHLGWKVTEHEFEPDGNFPNGVPNPILKESRRQVETALKEGDYDLGVAWDGDYDRCFFFKSDGTFIEGYYLVGVLAEAMLRQNPGEAIIYDPRLTWNTIDVVERNGGRPVLCKSGHAFIKEKMRQENAVYGGEMSAHHYFRDNWYCDSGIIPLLLIAQLLSVSGETLDDLVDEMIAKYPCSGEINSHVDDTDATLERIEHIFVGGKQTKVDGLSVEYSDWRFNLRASNTEPVIRLNVETRGNRQLLEEKTAELLQAIRM